MELDIAAASEWLSACLKCDPATLADAVLLKRSPGREVWDCTLRNSAVAQQVILKFFQPCDPTRVNSSLPAVDAARKCFLAKRELSALEIPTAQAFQLEMKGDLAAFVCEKLRAIPWTPQARIDAARMLAKLHHLDAQRFSPELAALVHRSDPRHYRTLAHNGRIAMLDGSFPDWRSKHPDVVRELEDLAATSPPLKSRCLVHGDYFSANLILTAVGLRIIDWETLAFGDPMWDLGFLIGADAGLPQSEVDAVIDTYASNGVVKLDQLNWHKRNWDMLWRLLEIDRSRYSP